MPLGKQKKMKEDLFNRKVRQQNKNSDPFCENQNLEPNRWEPPRIFLNLLEPSAKVFILNLP